MKIKTLTIQQTDQLEPFIGQDLVSRLWVSRHQCTPLPGGGYLMVFRVCLPEKIDSPEERVCLCDLPDGLVMVTDSVRCRQLMEQCKVSENSCQQLVSFFHLLTAKDIDYLEQTETKIEALEDSLLTGTIPLKKTASRIIRLRKILLRLKRYYEQLSLVLSELCDSETGWYTKEDRKRLSALDRRVDKLLDFTLHLREYVTQVREAYQAQIDIEQNQIMKIFTVLTAIFLPLTLIVGWYGMNFQIPEYAWRYGYIYVIVLSIVVCTLCVFLFKRKKWF